MARYSFFVIRSSFVVALLAAFCAEPPDYFPLVKGLAWESKSTTTTIVDNDTTQSEKTTIVAIGERIVYGTLGRVVQVNEIAGRDTTPRYYRKRNGDVWLLWEKIDERPDSALVLPAKTVVGTRWVFWRGRDTIRNSGANSGYVPGDSGAIYCTAENKEDVSVPAGNFRAVLKVAFDFGGRLDFAETRWYAPGAGVIKDDFTHEEISNGHTMKETSITELVSVAKDNR
jgi:hypothetical protein